MGRQTLSHPDVAPLYRLRRGKPLGDEREENGVYWRPFEAGLVAVNPDRRKPGSITVRPPIPESNTPMGRSRSGPCFSAARSCGPWRSSLRPR